MMHTTSPTTDPEALLRSLDVETLLQRVYDLDAERKATIVLLRAAQKRQRAAERRPAPAANRGGADA
jgi:hypothetical protein